MSTPQDMAQCQCRNSSGYPVFGGDNRGNFSHQDDHSVNKALPWVAVACILAGLALGVSVMMRPIMDAMDAKAKAELRAEIAQELAEVRAEARQAGDDAAIWKNRVVKLEARIDERR